VAPKNGKEVLTQSLEVRVVVGYLGHMEERDEGLISRLDKKGFERIMIK
jgi:hypothetical protein